MDPLIRSISGLRGIAGTSFNNDIIISHVNAFLSFQKIGTVLVARDGRTHGENYLNICFETIKNAGFNVIDCGIIPTPTAQFLVKENKYSGGVILTASHNPTEWNGLKFLDSDGCFVNPKKTQQLLDRADENIQPKNDIIGEISHNEKAWISHINHTLNLSCINIEKIKSRNFKVVVDAVNSAGSIIIPQLLNELNCEVTKINCNSDGHFARGPEPIPENLKQLSEKVIEVKADFGLATDPDADRLAIVDENGEPLGEEFTLALAIDGYFQSSNTNNAVVVNLSTSMLSEYSCKKHDIELVRSKVGEINVVEEMIVQNSDIGGEGNGGVILKESHLGRDSVIATALSLNRFAMTSQHVSEIKRSFPNYKLIKDKVSIEGLNPDKILNLINSKFGEPEKDIRDGLKLTWTNKWIHIRKSNTEPIMRIYAESENENNLIDSLNLIKIIIDKSRKEIK
jgi:phosphomannomutase